MTTVPAWPDTAREALRGTPVQTAWRSLVFRAGARRERQALDGVRTYCLFLGHARSGHSVIGALLDAHRQIAISDEFDALRYLEAGFTRGQLLYGSLEIARRQAANLRRKQGRGGTTYSYHVPDGWQGRADDLRVVGDSRAGWTTRRLAADPGLLDRLQQRMAPSELRFVHVVRNPYDNIATMMLRGERSFESAFGQYAANCEAIGPLSERIGAERVLQVRHEALIADPRATLAELCIFLGVEADEPYLAAASAQVYRSPARSRREIEWRPDDERRVDELIRRFAFLAGYGRDDEPEAAAASG
ncbi:MAG TPA: sulfotransferase [Candidatus Limnocylindria bacterium]